MKHNAWLMTAVFSLCMVISVKYLFAYFTPFFIGIVIATLIHPLIDQLERKGIPRSLVACGFVLIIFGSLLLLFGFTINRIWIEMKRLLDVFQELYQGTYQWAQNFGALVDSLPEPFSQVSLVVLNQIYQVIINLFAQLTNAISSIPSVCVSFILAAVTTFFISRDKRIVVGFLTSLMPKTWHERFFGLKREIVQGLLKYLKAQVVLMIISTCISLAGFLLFQVPYPWLLGLIVGVLDLLPLFGLSTVFIPLIILYVFDAQLSMAIALAAIWLLVMFVRQAWEPQIVGAQLGLHPVTSLMAVYLGVSLFGLSGFIIGPVLMICSKAFFIVVNN